MLVVFDKESIFAELELGDLAIEQKEELWQVMLDIFQTRIIERVLSLLVVEDNKREFLTLLSIGDEVRLKSFLDEKIENISEELSLVVTAVKKDLQKDIVQARRENS